MAAEIPPPKMPPPPENGCSFPFTNPPGSVSPDSKLVLVFRKATADSMIPPVTMNLLRALDLNRPGAVVFHKPDETVMDLLQKVEPFVTYGCPTRETVENLIYYRGGVRLNNQPECLKTGDVVAQAFGKYNIFNVNEIFNVGTHFDQVSYALAKFMAEKEVFLRKRGWYMDFRAPEGSAAPDSKLILVYRRKKEDSEIPAAARKSLHALGLNEPRAGVFHKVDGIVMPLLQEVKPFVTYGCPTRETVMDLLYYRGHVKVNNCHLKKNNVLVQVFGQYNIFSIQDVVNEIVNPSSHFDQVNNALAIFKIDIDAKDPNKKRRQEHRMVK